MVSQFVCLQPWYHLWVLIFFIDDYVDDSDESDIAELDEDNEDQENTFMRSYSDAMNEELKATTLQKSFVRANEQIPKKDQVFVCICVRKECVKC